MDEGTSNQIDPSSISLFNCPSPGDVATNDVIGISSKSITEGDVFKVDGLKISYSKYADNKGKEVAKRKIFVERMERMKEAKGIFFNIPQFNLATMNQICLSMKKFSRSNDVRSFISTDLLENVFADISTKQHKQLEAIEELFNGEEADILKNKIKPPIIRQITDTSDEDITDVEDYEFVDQKANLSAELYDLLEQRAQILTADTHAKRMLRELEQKQLWVETQLSNTQEELMFESSVSTGDDEVDSMTCARCRPLIDSGYKISNSTRSELLHHNFIRLNNNSGFRPLISNKKCGVTEYSFADESVHELLSLPSAISLDVQLQKYLHVISFISPEVELRRFKTSRIINQSNGKDISQKFYDLIEDSRDEQTSLDGHGSHYEEGERGIRLSLHKRNDKKRRRNANYSEDDDSDDPGDGDFVPLTTFLSSKKRRRMTFDNQQIKKLYNSSKPSKMENRRLSHVEFGASMFDYDAQLMDIGLPLPTIQNVENVEIAVPSYRRRPVLLENHLSSSICSHCQNSSEECKLWEDIRRLHGELESQERHNRCIRPPNIGTN